MKQIFLIIPLSCFYVKYDSGNLFLTFGMVDLRLWSLDQEPQHLLETYLNCSFLSLHFDILYQKLGGPSVHVLTNSLGDSDVP